MCSVPTHTHRKSKWQQKSHCLNERDIDIYKAGNHSLLLGHVQKVRKKQCSHDLSSPPEATCKKPAMTGQQMSQTKVCKNAKRVLSAFLYR